MIAQNPLKTGHSSPFYGKSWIDFKGREATVRQTWELRISGNFDRFMKNIGRNPLSFAVGLLIAACWLFTAQTHAATPGAAVVKKVVGTATYTDAKGGGPLKEADVLLQGATITTGAGSYVDLDMGVNGNALRVEADSSLTLTKLDFTRAGEVIVNTEVDVKKGSAVANVVNKLSKASKYEIKTPAGVAGIRGTVLRAGTTRIVCLIGRIEFRPTAGGGVQLVITGGTGVQAGNNNVVKATTVETTGLARSACSLTANTLSTLVTQAVQQFTAAIAAEAATEAGKTGGNASAEAAAVAKTVLAALVQEVQQAAAQAPPAVREAVQKAAASLQTNTDAVGATAAATAAAAAVVNNGGNAQQAKAAANQAAQQAAPTNQGAAQQAANAVSVAAINTAIQARTDGSGSGSTATLVNTTPPAVAPPPAPGPGPNNQPAPNTTPATTTTTTFISPTVGK